MSILCLTGWQQRADALIDIAPDAIHFDYASYDNAGHMFAALPREVDCAIGWSLGGLLLTRAVAGGQLRTKKLVLLGAPYRFVADNSFTYGMPGKAFIKFVHNYSTHPAETVGELNALIALGDARQATVARALKDNTQLWKHGKYWMIELGRASQLSYASFPPTIIVQGGMDRIVRPEHGKVYADHIAGAKLHLWPGCAHAPHLHDAEALRKIVADV